jgi:hypothetical protein
MPREPGRTHRVAEIKVFRTVDICKGPWGPAQNSSGFLCSGWAFWGLRQGTAAGQRADPHGDTPDVSDPLCSDPLLISGA